MSKIYLTDQIQVAHVMHIASLMHDYVYDKANVLFNEHNPCAVRDGMCISGRNGGNDFCCYGCKHLDENGCTVKALSCKLWLCSYCICSNEFIKKFDKLHLISYETWSEGLLWTGQRSNTPSLSGGLRTSKEEAMSLLYEMLLKYHTPEDVKLAPEPPLLVPSIITRPPRGYVIPYYSEEHYEYRQTRPNFFYVDNACTTKNYF